MYDLVLALVLREVSSQKCRDGYTRAEQGRTRPKGRGMPMEGDPLEDRHKPHREIRGPMLLFPHVANIQGLGCGLTLTVLIFAPLAGSI